MSRSPDRVRIGVAIYSYRDALTFGLTGDYDTVPDLHVLADGIAGLHGRTRQPRHRNVDA